MDPAQLEALNAELKLAKQQRMDLQKKVDEMDMDLRNAMDRANELQQQLDVKDSGVVDGELNDTQVLQAELKMAKQQRQALQTRVDDMDFELRQALDSANEANELKKKIEELEGKLAAAGDGSSGGGDGGGGGDGSANAAELEEERTKRTRLEKQLKEVKAELEDAKKSSGSSSILEIKMAAMKKEVEKARKALETATEGPAKQIEEQTKEIKELKDKVRKTESELDVALNRAAANEEALQQKLELRKELEELREQISSGKPTAEEEKKTPTYKLEKLEKENADLKDKLAALKASSGAATPAAGTPVGSPMVQRARGPVKKMTGSPGVPPKKGERIIELEKELESRDETIKRLEAEVASAKTASSAVAAAPVASESPRVPRRLGDRMDTSLQNELAEAQTLLARRDREISELQSQLQETMSQLSRSGIDASSSVSESPRTPQAAAEPQGAPVKRVPAGKQPLKKMFVKRKMGAKGGPGPKKVAPSGPPPPSGASE